MKIARYLITGSQVVAVHSGDGFIDYGALLESRGIRSEITGTSPERRLIRMINRGLLEESYIRENISWAKSAGRKFALDTAGLTPLLPLRPSKIVCIARNWRSHAQERGHDLPDRPIYFVKTENCVIGPGVPIPVPTDVGRVDHEGELGVVISRKAQRIKAEDASRFIHSYTVINDVTARTLQHDLSRQSLPWYAAKSMDGFAPLGPFLVLPGEAEPLTGKRIVVKVNGETRQDGSLDDMNWKVPELLETVTRYITLEPGDMIATGTPAGVGPIQPGDEVTVEISGIGQLKNPVIARV